MDGTLRAACYVARLAKGADATRYCATADCTRKEYAGVFPAASPPPCRCGSSRWQPSPARSPSRPRVACSEVHHIQVIIAPMQITRRLEFDAGHRIPHHASLCKHLHGHRYAMEITLSGDIITTEG